MHRIDNSKYLLYIEPKKEEKSLEPNNDGLADIVENLIKNAKQGTARYSSLEDQGTFQEGYGYKGVHYTECGERSSNHDYLLENGMITNSLAPFYLRWYRDAIPESEMKKVNQLLKDLNLC